MMKKLALVMLLAFTISLMLSACTGNQGEGSSASISEVKSNYPERPINLIVPTNPGGGIDLWNRVLSAEMEKTLGKSILVNNMPGGGPGGTGTFYVWNQPHEGYFIAGTSETPLLIPVMTENMDQTADDWEYFIAGGSPGLLCVNKDSGYTTLEELIVAAKANPDEIKVASTAGGLWYILGNLFGKYADVPLGNATFDGSRTAITSCVSGETIAVVASAGEVIDFIKSGDLIPLAVFDSSDLDMEGIGKVEAVVKQAPELEKYLPLKQFVGFMVPMDTPEDIKAKLKEAFAAAIASDAVKEFAETQYAVIYNLTGEEAKQYCLKAQSNMSWMLFDMGMTIRSPEALGIPKP